MTGCCESCKKYPECRKDIGVIWGHCNTDYEPLAKTVYVIRDFYGKFAVCKMQAGNNFKMFLVSTRKGKDEWRGDLSWARRYTYKTAKKHVERMLSADPNAVAVLCGEIVKG